jgi:hypothetical protein
MLFNGRRKDQGMHGVREIAIGRGMHIGSGHQEAKQGHYAIEIFYGVGRVFMHIAGSASYGNLVAGNST